VTTLSCMAESLRQFEDDARWKPPKSCNAAANYCLVFVRVGWFAIAMACHVTSHACSDDVGAPIRSTVASCDQVLSSALPLTTLRQCEVKPRTKFFEFVAFAGPHRQVTVIATALLTGERSVSGFGKLSRQDSLRVDGSLPCRIQASVRKSARRSQLAKTGGPMRISPVGILKRIPKLSNFPKLGQSHPFSANSRHTAESPRAVVRRRNRPIADFAV
jgi:hypothetical protein